MSQEIMTVADLKQVLAELAPEIDDNFEIWLSSDEEGNEFLPMLRDMGRSIGFDKSEKKIIFFPSHQ
ncbi:MAG: hypothetical protein ABR969_00770 [Sedimentisphaerales bacterium]|jgi:hypothetical protein